VFRNDSEIETASVATKNYDEKCRRKIKRLHKATSVYILSKECVSEMISEVLVVNWMGVTKTYNSFGQSYQWFSSITKKYNYI
jgi:hypothetical protein